MSNDPDDLPTTQGPPYGVDTIAALHAGLYPPELAGQLRRAVADDPAAAAVLRGLESTVDDLSLLPTPRMPDRYAFRLDAAISAESAERSARNAAGADRAAALPQPRTAVNDAYSPTGRGVRRQDAPGTGRGAPHPDSRPGIASIPPRRVPPAPDSPMSDSPGPAPVPQVPGQQPEHLPDDRPGGSAVRSLGTAPSARARSARTRWLGAAGIAAAVIAIGTVTVSSLTGSDGSKGSGGQALAPPAPAAGLPTSTAGTELPDAFHLDLGRLHDAYALIAGRQPSGTLADPTVYRNCLAANHVVPADVTGVTEVTFDGRPASGIAVTVDATSAKILVVGPSCGVNGAAALLASQNVPR